MKFYTEGETGVAICPVCKGRVGTTFVRRHVPFSDGNGHAPNVLVAVCNQCDHVLAVPPQSVPAIREARQKVTAPLEANLPAVYLDVLDLAAYTVDKDLSTDFRRVLVSYFVHKTAQNKSGVASLTKHYKQALNLYPEKRGLVRRRLSMKVPTRIGNEIKLLQEQSQLKTTGIIKALVFDIQTHVIEKPNQTILKELRNYAAMM
jgi:hypothetical protein